MSEDPLGLQDELKNSIEIGETSKGFLYLKSVKRYYGYGVADMEYALDILFATYDKAKEAINKRNEASNG